MQSRLIPFLALALLLAACADRPAVAPVAPADLPSAWRETPTAGPALKAEWWRDFGDPGLDALMRTALAGNLDLKVAAARRDLLDAERGIAAAGRWPQIVGKFLATDRDRKSSEKSDSRRFRATADVAYELDLWGAAAAAEAGDEARVIAAEAERKAAALSLSAEAARLWLEIAALMEMRRLAEAEVAALDGARSVARAQIAGGWATADHSAAVETRMLTVKREALALDGAEQAARRDLTVLAGANPGTVAIAPKPFPSLILPSPRPGLPAAVIAARPDIAVATAKLEAARAGVGEAVAARYPDFTLTGAVGFASETLKNFLSGPSLTWMVGLPVELKILDGGAGEARVARAGAAASEAEAEWRGRIVRALAEVEAALAESADGAEAEALAVRRIALMREAEGYAGRSASAGTGTRLEAGLARADRIAAERGLVDVRRIRFRAAVALAKALGGGAP